MNRRAHVLLVLTPPVAGHGASSPTARSSRLRVDPMASRSSMFFHPSPLSLVSRTLPSSLVHVVVLTDFLLAAALAHFAALAAVHCRRLRARPCRRFVVASLSPSQSASSVFGSCVATSHRGVRRPAFRARPWHLTSPLLTLPLPTPSWQAPPPSQASLALLAS